jgi:N-acetylmuramoyl-L-alanine amidase
LTNPFTSGRLTLACALLLAASARAQTADPVVVAHTPEDAATTLLPGVMNRTTIVLDASHGGADSGALIGEAGSNSVLEKNVTLALALKLQTLLTARGFTVVMTRTGDAAAKPNAPASGGLSAAMTLDDRAGIANHARAAACLLIHAAASGHGVHLYTSELDGVSAEAPLLQWSTAQAAWVSSSAQLEKQLGDSLQLTGVPRTVGRASVRPVDSLTCPAVAIELAPEGESALSVSDSGYQQRVAQGLASALEQWSRQVQPPPRIAPAPKPKPASSPTPAPVATPHPIQIPGAQP